MQYGQALDRLIREVMIADTALGPVYVLKSDVSDGFCHIVLQPADAPKLGLVSPSYVQGEEMVAIPLTLIMVWKKSPPILCMSTETVADLANTSLRCNKPYQPHKMDNRVEAVVISG